MEHKGTIRIETKRLILRRFTARDYESVFHNIESDHVMTKYLTWQASDELATAVAVVDGWVKSYEKDDFYHWAIVPKDIAEPIGAISAVGVDEHLSRIEIGYCIGSSWWHRGYASEALAAIIPFFFEQVKVNRIQGLHDVANPNSGKVMLKCGLKYEGTLRANARNNQGIVDARIYGMLASDYSLEGKAKR